MFSKLPKRPTSTVEYIKFLFSLSSEQLDRLKVVGSPENVEFWKEMISEIKRLRLEQDAIDASQKAMRSASNLLVPLWRRVVDWLMPTSAAKREKQLREIDNFLDSRDHKPY